MSLKKRGEKIPDMQQYLQPTLILDSNSKEIGEIVDTLIGNRDHESKVEKIYYFVRDEIKFGYNESDSIPASKVLKDGYGQCNTKGTLFMALLRAVKVPCRIHFFTIDKKVQKGIITGLHYKLAPDEIIHSWVEVLFHDKWINLEGIILDHPYLQCLKRKFDQSGYFEGYGVAVDGFNEVSTEWTGEDTYIQSKLIKKDYGLFDSPDDFYGKYSTDLRGIKKIFFKHHVREDMNRKVEGIRDECWLFFNKN